MNTIFLHIGMHKTGSTAIQSSFNGLNNGKTRYAKLGYENHSIPFYTAFSGRHKEYNIWRRAGIGVNQIEQIRSECLNRIKQEFSNSGPENIIISGEDISLLPISGLQGFRQIVGACTNVKIIIYVREPISFMVSNLQENIKNGAAVVSPTLPMYEFRIKKFQTVFGVENVVIRHFAAEHLYENDIVKDFSRLVGVAAPRKGPSSNTSISTEAVKIIYLLNQMISEFGEPIEYLQARKSLIDHAKESFPGKFFLPPHLITGCIDTEDVNWLYSATGIDFRNSQVEPTQFSRQALDLYLSTLEPSTLATIRDYVKQTIGLREVPKDAQFLLARYFMSFLKKPPKEASISCFF